MNSYKLLAVVAVGALTFVLLEFIKACVSIGFSRNVGMSNRIIAYAFIIASLAGFGILTAMVLDP